MRILIQRGSSASVAVDAAVVSAIGPGLLVLLGIEEADEEGDLEWLCQKLLNLRIFADQAGAMNLSVLDTGGEILLISQFTLHASCKKGNRPSFIRAARPEKALPLYEGFGQRLAGGLGKPVGMGVFGAHMEVALVNDGPVTIWLDSRQRE